MARIRCAYERDFFPAEDFDETSDFGLVHERNRGDAPRHTTTGRLVGDNNWDSGWVGPGDDEPDYWENRRVDPGDHRYSG